MSKTIRLDTAIKQMKELSEKNIPFKFSFTSYSETRNTSKGIIIVQAARLRPSHSGELLCYFDLSKQKEKSCHACLLMTFNNQQILL